MEQHTLLQREDKSGPPPPATARQTPTRRHATVAGWPIESVEAA